MLTTKVAGDSEIGRLIREAQRTGEPLQVDTGEAIYTLRVQGRELTVEPANIWANYNPERVLQALEQATGILEGVDRDQLLADLREQRAQDSKGRPQ